MRRHGPWVALLLIATAGYAQSLGDVARQETERRKKVQSEKGSSSSVVGEEALAKAADQREREAANGESAPSQPTPNASGQRSAPRPAEPQNTPSAANNDLERERQQREKDEATWRKRMANAEARVQKARAHHDRVKGLTLTPGDYLVDERGRVVVRSVEHLQQIVADAKGELEAAEKALEDLTESARREGVPPGWLR
jgi:hypothetical protein